MPAARAQVARNCIKSHQYAGMAEVAVVIYCHAADIHADVAGNQWDKFLFLASERVVDFHVYMFFMMALTCRTNRAG